MALPSTLLAVQLLVLSLATPSPMSFVPAKVEARGVLRDKFLAADVGFQSQMLARLEGE